MNKNLDLCISNLGTVRNNQYQMAILPWGATEPHNLHLPYLTDCILSHSIAVMCGSILRRSSFWTISESLLPTKA